MLEIYIKPWMKSEIHIIIAIIKTSKKEKSEKDTIP